MWLKELDPNTSTRTGGSARSPPGTEFYDSETLLRLRDQDTVLSVVPSVMGHWVGSLHQIKEAEVLRPPVPWSLEHSPRGTTPPCPGPSQLPTPAATSEGQESWKARLGNSQTCILPPKASSSWAALAPRGAFWAELGNHKNVKLR